MLVKTSDLDGAALDWAVAKVAGLPGSKDAWVFEDGYWRSDEFNAESRWEVFNPSIYWDWGGPLIDEKIERIDTIRDGKEDRYIATTGGWPMGEARGKTILISAMRAIVAAELGDTVDIPDEPSTAA